MIEKRRIDRSTTTDEFGLRCQRLIPWSPTAEQPPLGAMACFLAEGTSSAPDRHAQDEVMFVLSGTGRADIGGRSVDIETGDMIVIPGGETHVIHNSGPASLDWLSVYWPLHEPEAGERP